MSWTESLYKLGEQWQGSHSRLKQLCERRAGPSRLQGLLNIQEDDHLLSQSIMIAQGLSVQSLLNTYTHSERNKTQSYVE